MGFINNIDRQYQALLQDILDNGVEKKDRTGTGTISVFGRQIRHKMSEGFPLLTTKKMPWKSIVTELLWFLQGNTNIKWLVDNGCNIWNGDAYKNYCKEYWNLSFIQDKIEYGSSFYNHDTEDYTFEEFTQEEFINEIKTDDEFAEKWGELGPIYGKQWRKWDGKLNGGDDVCIDQIQNLINDLKTNPDSRRLMVNAWNVGELDQMVLPPCHYGFQVYTRELSLEERATIWNNTHNPVGNIYTHNQYDENDIPARAISLMWNQRSVDTGLGLPFNIASYGLLLTMLAEEVNMVPDQLIGNLGDVHLYSNHVEPIKEQFGRKLTFNERTEMLKEKMGEENYDKAVGELMPFGGGMSEFYESYKIPYESREPLPLPKVIINPNNKMRIGGEIFTYDIGDFTLEDYISHPPIKLPLSN